MPPSPLLQPPPINVWPPPLTRPACPSWSPKEFIPIPFLIISITITITKSPTPTIPYDNGVRPHHHHLTNDADNYPASLFLSWRRRAHSCSILFPIFTLDSRLIIISMMMILFMIFVLENLVLERSANLDKSERACAKKLETETRRS